MSDITGAAEKDWHRTIFTKRVTGPRMQLTNLGIRSSPATEVCHESTTADTCRPGLKKALNQRQLRMIAIGGVIGAGLFVGSGVVMADTGPASSSPMPCPAS